MTDKEYKYNCILYDFDGTLADSVPVIMESFRQAYIEVLGECQRSDESLMSYIGRPLMDTFAMHDEETAKKLFDTYLRINCQMLEEDKVKLFEGVIETISELKKLGIKQGIVTSKRRDSIDITLKLKNMNSLFDIIVCKEDTTKHKPDGEPLVFAMNKLGIDDIRKIVYVGDALPDALCARNAGCDFILTDWTYMDRTEIMKENPEHVICSMNELSCIITGQQL